jgi:TonB family protein
MSSHALSAADEVFSVLEIAQAAGVSEPAARELIEAGHVRSADGFLRGDDAVVCVRALRRLAQARDETLFGAPVSAQRSTLAGIAGSSLFHLSVAGLLALIAAMGFTPVEKKPERSEPVRLVFLMAPGPGGGGGGGGLKQPDPPARARMKSPVALVRSPVPRPKPITTQPPQRITPPTPPPPPVVAEKKPEPPPPPPVRPDVKPQVVAPVVSAAPDPIDKAGVLTESAPDSNSQGRGSGSGAGTGQGTGIGEGTGPGIGEGSGGGTGGGPYRPGAGITPPSLVHEVRPDYTDAARRQGLAGEVVLEVVIKRDGTVGETRVLHGLGGGLDERAIAAVRQWRFTPARRHGTPVDVIVEVAVEFKLR